MVIYTILKNVSSGFCGLKRNWESPPGTATGKDEEVGDILEKIFQNHPFRHDLLSMGSGKNTISPEQSTRNGRGGCRVKTAPDSFSAND
jgi:hypothetical protein